MAYTVINIDDFKKYLVKTLPYPYPYYYDDNVRYSTVELLRTTLNFYEFTITYDVHLEKRFFGGYKYVFECKEKTVGSVIIKGNKITSWSSIKKSKENMEMIKNVIQQVLDYQKKLKT